MRDAADRVLRESSPSRPQGFVLISEAVWWVTIVDATLVRYHPEAYNAVLAGRAAAEREAIEGTLAGLRFVRNWMGYHADHGDFIRPQPGRQRPGGGQIAAWTWRRAPEPAVASFPPMRQEWEMGRYQAYQAHLAGHAVGETFGRAAAFLVQATAQPAALPGRTLVPHVSRHPLLSGVPLGKAEDQPKPGPGLADESSRSGGLT